MRADDLECGLSTHTQTHTLTCETDIHLVTYRGGREAKRRA